LAPPPPAPGPAALPALPDVPAATLAADSLPGRPPAYPPASAPNILTPGDGEILAFDPGLAEEFQRLRVVVQGGPGLEALVIRHNGAVVARRPAQGRAAALLPLALGRLTLVLEALAGGRVVDRRTASFEVR
jgi:hypothetical protein